MASERLPGQARDHRENDPFSGAPLQHRRLWALKACPTVEKRLEAQDNGKGINVDKDPHGNAPGKGNVLRTIADSVKLLDGKVEVESDPGKGTLVTILLQLTRNTVPI